MPVFFQIWFYGIIIWFMSLPFLLLIDEYNEYNEKRKKNEKSCVITKEYLVIVRVEDNNTELHAIIEAENQEEAQRKAWERFPDHDHNKIGVFEMEVGE